MNKFFQITNTKLLKRVSDLSKRDYWSSKDVRRAFADHFNENSHTFTPSSPVIPWNDSSLDFVNAGMNQFKPIFVGNSETPLKRAFNSQKCIRVGGMHNDLIDVGRDTYHHTFFEMLGSWSFNDYFKEEACRLAWDLLTNVYKISPEHLYVTYFCGDQSLGIGPDKETKEMWKLVGVPEEKILPFGAKENFWEMGKVGPCGPCTEIHFAHLPSTNMASAVNTGSKSVIELWNIVFVQYERLPDGSLISLDKHYIDTGMGLERLTASLNGNVSNYDTDLFKPLFHELQKMSKMSPYRGTFEGESNTLDTAYRIIADHTRMMTACLCDGLLPHDSYILRHLIRRTLITGWNSFGLKFNAEWLGNLAEHSSEILSDTYPEMKRKLSDAKLLLKHEEELLIGARKETDSEWQKIVSAHPNLLSVTSVTSSLVKVLDKLIPVITSMRNRTNRFPSKAAAEFCLEHNIKVYIFEEILCTFDMTVNTEEFNIMYDKLQMGNISGKQSYNSDRDTSELLRNQSILKTCSNPYTYQFDLEKQSYIIPQKSASVCAIIKDGKLVLSADQNAEVSLVLDSTNFYSEAGGQAGDVGVIETKDSKFKVKRTKKLKEYVIHVGVVTAGNFNVGDDCTTFVHNIHRSDCSKLHTVQHLFIAALRAVTGMVYQRNSEIKSKLFQLDVFSYPSVQLSHITKAEKIVQEWIRQQHPISRHSMSIQEALQVEDLDLVSGDQYPELVHLISSSCSLHGEFQIEKDACSVQEVTSCELCCGTHVHNSGHIQDFSITKIKFQSHGMVRIEAVVGEAAILRNSNAIRINEEMENLSTKITKAIKNNDRVRGLDKQVKKWIVELKVAKIPFTLFLENLDKANDLLKKLNAILRPESNWMELEKQACDIAKTHPGGPLIHHLDIDFRGSQDELMNILKRIENTPVVFTCAGWGKVRAAIKIPKNHCSENLSVEHLLHHIKTTIGGGTMKVHSSSKDEEEQHGNFIVTGVKREAIQHNIDLILKSSEEYMSQL